MPRWYLCNWSFDNHWFPGTAAFEALVLDLRTQSTFTQFLRELKVATIAKTHNHYAFTETRIMRLQRDVAETTIDKRTVLIGLCGYFAADI
jgi:hypothetical protein